MSNEAALRRAMRRYHARQAGVEEAYDNVRSTVLEARQTMTLRQIAKATGLTFARVHQIEKEARSRAEVLQP